MCFQVMRMQREVTLSTDIASTEGSVREKGGCSSIVGQKMEYEKF